MKNKRYFMAAKVLPDGRLIFPMIKTGLEVVGKPAPQAIPIATSQVKMNIQFPGLDILNLICIDELDTDPNEGICQAARNLHEKLKGIDPNHEGEQFLQFQAEMQELNEIIAKLMNQKLVKINDQINDEKDTE